MGNLPLPVVPSLYFIVYPPTLSNEIIHNPFENRNIIQKTELESLYHNINQNLWSETQNDTK